MEIPTLDDFKRLEHSLSLKLDEILEKVNELSTKPTFTKILTVKEVEEEFKQSAYSQRNARTAGKLIYNKVGKEITYRREDVEDWLKLAEVRY